MEYPRVVILSMTDISSSTATGSLLRELFADIPSDNIFQITVQTSKDEVSREYLQRSELSTSKSLVNLGKRIWIVKGVLRRLKTYRSDLLREISQFKPDLVYIRIVDNLYPYRELVEIISEKFQTPIVSHIMDDYESAMAQSPSLYTRFLKRFFFRRDLRFIFGVSKFNFAISDSMSLAFQKRYGVCFEVFHNGIDPAQWGTSAESRTDLSSESKRNSNFRMVMAGSIDKLKDANVISQFARVVHDLNLSGDLDCELVLNVSPFYMSAATQLANSNQGVIAQEYQPLEDYRKLLSTADCLILARNSDEITKSYTGLSFHNKLPEYLASGTLIFCIGPEWDGSVQFLKENRCGVVVSNATDSEICENILAMVTNPEQFEEFLINAKNIAVKNFDVRPIRTRFKQRLLQAAST